MAWFVSARLEDTEMADVTIPISYNSMTDDELKLLVDDPNGYLGGLNAIVRPSPIQPITKSKIEGFLQQKHPTKSPQELQRDFNTYAMVKLKVIVIDL